MTPALILLQAMGPPALPRVLPPALPQVATRCGAERGTDPDEIRVCGDRDRMRHRLKPLAPQDDGPPRATIGLNERTTLGAGMEQGRFGPQVMVRLKFRF